MLKLLIVEGNVKESRDQSVARGALTQGDLYKRVLNALGDDLACELDCAVVFPADEGADLPAAEQLADYDGIVWTGSALNIYDGGPAIERQIAFMKQGLEQDTRIFGSCWGLQMATVAAGGEVAANTKGREIGIARDIQVTQAGLDHPLYRGKPKAFDAVAVHLDHVVKLPDGACILSSNAMSEVQAIEMKRGRSVFWGVQYHPEFDLEYIADIIRKYEGPLIKEGISADADQVAKWAGDMEAIHFGKDQGELTQQYRLGEDVTDFASRLREVSNWLCWLRDAKLEDSSASQAADLANSA